MKFTILQKIKLNKKGITSDIQKKILSQLSSEEDKNAFYDSIIKDETTLKDINDELKNEDYLPKDDITPKPTPAMDTTPKPTPAMDTTPKPTPAMDTTPKPTPAMDTTPKIKNIPENKDKQNITEFMTQFLQMNNKNSNDNNKEKTPEKMCSEYMQSGKEILSKNTII